VGGVDAANTLLHASVDTLVTQPESTSASVAKFAIVGVWLPFSGSWMVLPVVIRRILTHLGLPTAAPTPRPPPSDLFDWS
jgi:hypothetical protein